MEHTWDLEQCLAHDEYYHICWQYLEINNWNESIYVHNFPNWLSFDNQRESYQWNWQKQGLSQIKQM